MFGFKKDRITKIIEAEENALYKQYENNMISQIDMHNKMKEQIDLIYSNDSISFADIVKRKYFLTGFQPKALTITASFFIGILGAWFFEFANDLKKWLDNSFKTLIPYFVVAIFLVILLMYIVVSITKFSNPKDTFLTKDYEVSVINDTIKRLEEKENSQ